MHGQPDNRDVSFVQFAQTFRRRFLSKIAHEHGTIMPASNSDVFLFKSPKALSTLSQKSATVLSQLSETRRKRRDAGDSLTFLRQCGQGLMLNQNVDVNT